MTEPLKIGVLLSGSGTNLHAIIDAAAEGLPVEIVHVVSSRPDAFGIERAHRAGIPVTVLNRDVYADPVEADKRIAETLRYAHAEYVVMAGYMRKVTPVLLDAFPDRVLNLHPALLPSFKGAHAIQDAFDAGVKRTRTTTRAPSWRNAPWRCARTTPSTTSKPASTRSSTSCTPKCCASWPKAA